MPQVADTPRRNERSLHALFRLAIGTQGEVLRTTLDVTSRRGDRLSRRAAAEAGCHFGRNLLSNTTIC
jgi:hypothetical protein